MWDLGRGLLVAWGCPIAPPPLAGKTIFLPFSCSCTFAKSQCWCGSVSKISVLFFWLLCLSLSQFNIISIIASNNEYWNWVASLTQWTWVWVNSGSWWWTGRPGMLRSMGSQRVGHDWATELNWMKYIFINPLHKPHCCQKVGHERILMCQVSGELLGQATKWRSSVSHRK